MTPSPVKEWALNKGIDVLTPEKLRDEALIAELKNTDWDFFLVASYGKILPRTMLDIPSHGCVNIHPSLLPKFRGPSPFLSAILADERQTGVSLMCMEEKMDAGPILAQARIEIDESDWPPQGHVLGQMLFSEGGSLLAEILERWLSGNLTPEIQDELAATYTRKFTDEDARLDLSGDPRANFLKIRAFDHGPRAYYMQDGMRVIVTAASWVDGKLIIERVIPEGKKEIPFEEFSRQNR